MPDRHGDAGGRVLEKSILNQCYSAGLAVDGSLGPKTETALKHAQKVGGVSQDGIYGTNTRNHMIFPNQDNAGHCNPY